MTGYALTFKPARASITEAVTKFGGQPVWIDGPQWPLSVETGEPMQFIAQVVLEPELFGEIPAKMAYLFMTDSEDVDSTWEVDSGENALIIQPGEENPPTQPLETGPSLYAMEAQPGERFLQPVPVEFAVELVPFDASTPRAQPESRDFIGGLPNFLQGEEYPDDETEWKLVLQLDSTTVPFWINFGDAGVGYAFISKDGRQGKFLWQCC